MELGYNKNPDHHVLELTNYKSITSQLVGLGLTNSGLDLVAVAKKCKDVKASVEFLKAF